MARGMDSAPRFGMVLRNRFLNNYRIMLVCRDANDAHFVDERGAKWPQWRAVALSGNAAAKPGSLIWATGPWTAWVVES